jgi:hypothetical protein
MTINEAGVKLLRDYSGANNLSVSNEISDNAIMKGVAAGTAATRSLCVNGGTVATSATAAAFAASSISWSSSGQLWYRQIMDLPIRLSDANLQTLTT